MRIHLIAIGGSVMHNLALELQRLGHEITGSDDEIYDPARSRLFKAGLLPDQMGWYPKRIHRGLDQVILGMHAHSDNPELQTARGLGIPVKSFPEFVADHIRHTKKIVVTGSHGKTTTTAMIMHAVKQADIEASYLVGGLIPGFERMVKLSKTARVSVIEGDEYPSSRLDRRPKMLLYKADVVIVTGIAWDHMNIFTTFEDYKAPFEKLISQLPEGGCCIYYQEDETLKRIIDKSGLDTGIPYKALSADNNGSIIYNSETYPVKVFGRHNLANMHAAMIACQEIGIAPREFLQYMASFPGVDSRLEVISRKPLVYKDFAHAPSKVRATLQAVRDKHPGKRILACLELHTYSSLNASFIPQYRGTLDPADGAIVLFDPHAVRLKRLDTLDPGVIQQGFRHENLTVVQSGSDLEDELLRIRGGYDLFLIMSSGNLGGMKLSDLNQ